MAWEAAPAVPMPTSVTTTQNPTTRRRCARTQRVSFVMAVVSITNNQEQKRSGDDRRGKAAEGARSLHGLPDELAGGALARAVPRGARGDRPAPAGVRRPQHHRVT